jgi:hypothetical protein
MKEGTIELSLHFAPPQTPHSCMSHIQPPVADPIGGCAAVVPKVDYGVYDTQWNGLLVFALPLLVV